MYGVCTYFRQTYGGARAASMLVPGEGWPNQESQRIASLRPAMRENGGSTRMLLRSIGAASYCVWLGIKYMLDPDGG